MLKPRLIAVLLLRNGIIVRSREFNFHQSLGDPIGQVERFSSWKADEIVYLDISREGGHDYRRRVSTIGSTTSKKDISVTSRESFIDVVNCISKKCMVPLTIGGKIRTLDDIRIRLKNGADKVSINTRAISDPSFITHAAKVFGSQCVIVSVDAKYDPNTNKHEIYAEFGKKPTGLDPVSWCREAEERGAGEILLNSIDRDGTGRGYDLELIRRVANSVSIPVIALGGVGCFEHFVEGLREGQATAVAAANIFNFTEQSIINAKKYMKAAGFDMRV